MEIERNHRQMPLCITCRQTIEAGYDVQELPGFATVKTRCAMCGRNTYGGVYHITVKKDRRKSND